MYGSNFYYELSLILSWVPLKRGRAELHTDTKNKAVGANIVDTEADGIFESGMNP